MTTLIRSRRILPDVIVEFVRAGVLFEPLGHARGTRDSVHLSVEIEERTLARRSETIRPRQHNVVGRHLPSSEKAGRSWWRARLGVELNHGHPADGVTEAAVMAPDSVTFGSLAYRKRRDRGAVAQRSTGVEGDQCAVRWPHRNIRRAVARLGDDKPHAFQRPRLRKARVCHSQQQRDGGRGSRHRCRNECRSRKRRFHDSLPWRHLCARPFRSGPRGLVRPRAGVIIPACLRARCRPAG